MFENAYKSLNNIIKTIEDRGGIVDKIETNFTTNWVGDDNEVDFYIYTAEIVIRNCDDYYDAEKYIKGIFNRFKSDYDFEEINGYSVIYFCMGFGDDEDLDEEDIYKYSDVKIMNLKQIKKFINNRKFKLDLKSSNKDFIVVDAYFEDESLVVKYIDKENQFKLEEIVFNDFFIENSTIYLKNDVFTAEVYFYFKSKFSDFIQFYKLDNRIKEVLGD